MEAKDYDDFVRTLSNPKVAFDNIGRAFLDATSISQIKSAQRANKLALVLGAGVSTNSGIPSWPQLVERLVNSSIDSSDDRLKRALLSERLNEIRRIRFLEAHSTGFRIKVRDCLYEGLDLVAPNITLAGVADFIVRSTSYSQPQNVITYNFDDLLESKIKEIDSSVEVVSIYSASSFAAKSSQITVFHPHGFCPRGELEAIVLGDFYLRDQSGRPSGHLLV